MGQDQSQPLSSSGRNDDYMGPSASTSAGGTYRHWGFGGQSGEEIDTKKRLRDDEPLVIAAAAAPDGDVAIFADSPRPDADPFNEKIGRRIRRRSKKHETHGHSRGMLPEEPPKTNAVAYYIGDRPGDVVKVAAPDYTHKFLGKGNKPNRRSYSDVRLENQISKAREPSGPLRTMENIRRARSRERRRR